MCKGNCNGSCPKCSPEDHKQECTDWYSVTDECVCDRLPDCAGGEEE